MNDIFQRIKQALGTIYTSISGIITIVAAVVFAICTIGMMAGKNQKTVEEFKTWRTRIITTWVVFFLLGAFVQLGDALTDGFNFDDYVSIETIS